MIIKILAANQGRKGTGKRLRTLPCTGWDDGSSSRGHWRDGLRFLSGQRTHKWNDQAEIEFVCTKTGAGHYLEPQNGLGWKGCKVHLIPPHAMDTPGALSPIPAPLQQVKIHCSLRAEVHYITKQFIKERLGEGHPWVTWWDKLITFVGEKHNWSSFLLL